MPRRRPPTGRRSRLRLCSAHCRLLRCRVACAAASGVRGGRAVPRPDRYRRRGLRLRSGPPPAGRPIRPPGAERHVTAVAVAATTTFLAVSDGERCRVPWRPGSAPGSTRSPKPTNASPHPRTSGSRWARCPRVRRLCCGSRSPAGSPGTPPRRRTHNPPPRRSAARLGTARASRYRAEITGEPSYAGDTGPSSRRGDHTMPRYWPEWSGWSTPYRPS